MSDLRIATPINDGVSRNGRLTLGVGCVSCSWSTAPPFTSIYNADRNEVMMARGGMKSGKDRKTDAPRTVETQTG